MARSTKVRARLLLALGVVLSMLLFALPSAASASYGSVDWTLRSSWVTYITTNWAGPGTPGPGTITAISPGRYTRPVVHVEQPSPIVGTLASYDGGFRSQLPAHYIDVSIDDIRINFTSGAVFATGSYVPLGGSATSYSDQQIATLSGGTQDGGSRQLLWFDAVPRLTAFGATIFNGGSNGSYRTGDAFGTLTAVGGW
ncbi:HtaA domain-containing protein [Conexibacter sp. JD483]|uniref:HtaA domain-containing protein n=1 Tax=unclassified Conexibacter TaxID=2627773 RepID=UPI002725D3A8|nr:MULTISPECIES: HtaA domain-containing protein [unclassified Conexibacter]MDO8188690.1 HtaA domain-containing protein [Conexibacter sp. CPCC 205706]MDO8201556.1 HtaA domain-containing protein [Conexibacter sp. CPCC 205762]MDR9371647.1 HtaA domain-containing protein [Conexibacter sp. JD483]